MGQKDSYGHLIPVYLVAFVAGDQAKRKCDLWVSLTRGLLAQVSHRRLEKLNFKGLKVLDNAYGITEFIYCISKSC